MGLDIVMPVTIAMLMQFPSILGFYIRFVNLLLPCNKIIIKMTLKNSI